MYTSQCAMNFSLNVLLIINNKCGFTGYGFQNFSTREIACETFQYCLHVQMNKLNCQYISGHIWVHRLRPLMPSMRWHYHVYIVFDTKLIFNLISYGLKKEILKCNWLGTSFLISVKSGNMFKALLVYVCQIKLCIW